MENIINYNYVITVGLVLIVLGFVGLNSNAVSPEWDIVIKIFQSVGYFTLGIGVFRKKKLEKELMKIELLHKSY
jgi:NADH:ubiquinone oxidoreductase subunit K